MEILAGEVEKRKEMLFGGHRMDMDTNAKKAEEWQHVADAVNTVASEGRTVAKKKKGLTLM